jgi:hypothetical protein
MLTLPLVLTAAVALAPKPSGGAETKIRACFERYRKAAGTGDGTAAARELDSNTIAYYAQLRTAALSATDVHALPPTDKLLVLRIRLELSPDQLSSFDGRALIAYAIGRGWAGGAQINNSSLGKITIEGDKANAELWMGGKPSGASLRFRREHADWRLDLAANNDNMKIAFSAMKARSKLSEDELILQILKETIGRPVPAKVWQPMTPRVP